MVEAAALRRTMPLDHNNEILNIIESMGIHLYYQTDKDWHYRTEERR